MAYFSEAEGLGALTLTAWPGGMTYAVIQPIIDALTDGMLPYDATSANQKAMSCFLLKEWVSERQNPANVVRPETSKSHKPIAGW